MKNTCKISCPKAWTRLALYRGFWPKPWTSVKACSYHPYLCQLKPATAVAQKALLCGIGKIVYGIIQVFLPSIFYKKKKGTLSKSTVGIIWSLWQVLREFSGCAPSKPLHPLASFASGETQFLHSSSHGTNQCKPDDVIKARLENQSYIMMLCRLIRRTEHKLKKLLVYRLMLSLEDKK